MKSQALPMRTIAIIILVLLVLVAVLLFFFSSFQQTGGVADEQSAVAECQSRCIQINMKVQKTANAKAIAANEADNVDFCDIIVAGENRACDEFVSCKVTNADCILSCSGGIATCS